MPFSDGLRRANRSAPVAQRRSEMANQELTLGCQSTLVLVSGWGVRSAVVPSSRPSPRLQGGQC